MHFQHVTDKKLPNTYPTCMCATTCGPSEETKTKYKHHEREREL